MALTPEQQEQADIMAEAMRQAFNPAVNDRLDLAKRQPPKPSQKIPCIAPSGAHFDAIVVASREHPQGRVVNLENFRYPPCKELIDNNYNCHDGPERFEWPRGFTPIHKGGEFSGQLTQDAKTLLAETLWPADLRRYVGKGLDPFIRADRQKEVAKFNEQQAQEHARFMAAEAAKAEPEPPAPKK